VNDLVRVALIANDEVGNAGAGASFSARRDENLLAAAQRAHWLIRFGCRNGNCEACAATLRQGCVEQRGLRIDASAAPQPILLCLAHARTDLQISLPGDPLHGSPTHARRCYAQLQQVERAGECWRLRFTLPAGKPLPVHAGQFLQIDSDPPFDAWLEEGALDGRALTVFATPASAAPVSNLAPGARVHLRYPLGYAYRAAVSTQPHWLLCEAATRLRAQRLRTLIPDSVLIDMDGAPAWPGVAAVVVHAYARDAATLQSWYRQLLDARVPFIELRSDFSILRRWQVWRQDDNGNRFVIADFLDEAAAREQVAMFTARGHKQLYWTEPAGAADPDSQR
jgi:ferredoxin